MIFNTSSYSFTSKVVEPERFLTTSTPLTTLTPLNSLTPFYRSDPSHLTGLLLWFLSVFIAASVDPQGTTPLRAVLKSDGACPTHPSLSQISIIAHPYFSTTIIFQGRVWINANGKIFSAKSSLLSVSHYLLEE